MKEIVFLEKDHILRLHENAIQDYGGSTYIRDEISQNQPFSDGNKRTGLLAMYTFLKTNWLYIECIK